MQTLSESEARPVRGARGAGPPEPEPGEADAARRYVMPEVHEVPPEPRIEAPEEVEW
ncbi:MAG TPA: hypothetical protein VH418_11065 [Solirubrobacteraceae bacterium]|jgi:hypothetical protein